MNQKNSQIKYREFFLLAQKITVILVETEENDKKLTLLTFKYQKKFTKQS